jgi:hypothetical protein
MQIAAIVQAHDFYPVTRTGLATHTGKPLLDDLARLTADPVVC